MKIEETDEFQLEVSLDMIDYNRLMSGESIGNIFSFDDKITENMIRGTDLETYDLLREIRGPWHHMSVEKITGNKMEHAVINMKRIGTRAYTPIAVYIPEDALGNAFLKALNIRRDKGMIAIVPPNRAKVYDDMTIRMLMPKY